MVAGDLIIVWQIALLRAVYSAERFGLSCQDQLVLTGSGLMATCQRDCVTKLGVEVDNCQIPVAQQGTV